MSPEASFTGVVGPVSACSVGIKRDLRAITIGLSMGVDCNLLILNDLVMPDTRLALILMAVAAALPVAAEPPGGRRRLSRRLLPACLAVPRRPGSDATAVATNETDHSSGIGRRRAGSGSRGRASSEDLEHRAVGSRSMGASI